MREVITPLNQLLQLYVAAGAAGPAKDIKSFIDVLKPHGDREVAAFVEEARSLLRQAVEKPKGRAKSPAKRPAGLTIEEHAGALRVSGTDRNAFDAALDRLKADKSLKVDELIQIAGRYTGTTMAHKTKAAAYKDIAQAFIRNARFENKLG
jgi:hypothetical protein